MILNECGQIASNEWMRREMIRPNIYLDVFVVMSNSIHGIVIIDSGMTNGLLNFNRSDHSGNWAPAGPKSNSVAAIIAGYRSTVTRQINELSESTEIPNQKVWQRNYYEHIIRNKTAYQNIKNYILKILKNGIRIASTDEIPS